jgi:hypothetical protein
MFRTSVLVSALTVATVLFAVGAGGVAAQEQSPDSVATDTAAVAQQEFVEVEVIVEDRAGNRLRNIEVVAEWGDGQTVSDTSTSQGRVLLDVPANTDVEFSVNDSDERYVRNNQPVTVEPGDTDDPIRIQMALRGSITFSVVDTNGNPVSGTQLRLKHENDPVLVDIVSTDEDGTVTIPGIEQRSYTVRITRPGYKSDQRAVDVTGEQVTEEIEIESARVNVDFTVLDDHFTEPRPLKDAEVEIEGVGSPIPTDENGETQARIPVNDDYAVTVVLDGYQEQTTTLRVGEEPTTLELKTQRDPSISINQLQNAIVVGQPTQVTITNSYDEPVGGAMVSLNDETVGETDPQGQIVFNITQAGSNTIDASYQSLSASTTLDGVDPTQDTADNSSDDADSEDEMDTDNSDDGSSTDEEEGADAIGPGFGPVVAVGAVIGLGFFAARRRS